VGLSDKVDSKQHQEFDPNAEYANPDPRISRHTIVRILLGCWLNTCGGGGDIHLLQYGELQIKILWLRWNIE
jgi:hypothetical protein